jgi:adenylosuccinate synthase
MTDLSLSMYKKTTNPKANVILINDLQFGSTGKGAIVGHLARNIWKPDTVITAWAPNAGHTFIDKSGRKYVHRMLANGIVSPEVKHVLIGPGSMVDLDVLLSEIDSCRDLIEGRIQIMMHEAAGIVLPEHRDIEQSTMLKIGSTAKGTGAALIQKIKRDPDDANTASQLRAALDWHRIWADVDVVSAATYAQAVDESDRILIEGAQGFSLGINSGFWPYTTSRDCTPGQIMTDCQVPLSKLMLTVGTLRTFPIRVANRFDADGNQIGTSGPCYPDQREMTWAEVGVPPEMTTVTKLERRVFSFSDKQFTDAMRACEPDLLFVNFMNYLGHDAQAAMRARINALVGKSIIRWEGHGPNEQDIVTNFMPTKQEA